MSNEAQLYKIDVMPSILLVEKKSKIDEMGI